MIENLCAQTSASTLSQSRARARALRERTSLRERELLLSTARDCLDHPSFTALPYAMRLLEVIASSREQSRTFPLQFGRDCSLIILWLQTENVPFGVKVRKGRIDEAFVQEEIANIRRKSDKIALFVCGTIAFEKDVINYARKMNPRLENAVRF